MLYQIFHVDFLVI